MRYFIYILYLLCLIPLKIAFAKDDLIEREVTKSSITKILKYIVQSYPSQDTTTLRLEEKNAIRSETVNKILAPYLFDTQKKSEKSMIFFEPRDLISKNTSNYTYTFYGKKLYYYQEGVKTSIKLRARFYLQKNTETNSYRRSKGFENSFFLELKIKNFNSKELDVSRKYRLLLNDSYFIEMFTKDKQHRLNTIENMKKDEEIKSKNKNAYLFLQALKALIEINPSFSEIQAAISYSRKSYKLIDQKYPLKKFLFLKFKKTPIEYQMTIDEDINVYKPDIYKIVDHGINTYLLEKSNSNIIFTYPKNTNFIEFKTPFQVSKKRYSKMSRLHKKLKKSLLYPLFDTQNMIKPMKKNKGKLSLAKDKF